MLQQITENNLSIVQNPAFADYLRIYLDIAANFKAQVATFGLDFALEDYTAEYFDRAARMQQAGLQLCNEQKSLYWNWISPACVTCRKACNTVTFFISLQCPRNCFFCFNVNQEGYEHFLTHQRDVAAELQQAYDSGATFTDIALSGGEPLLHKQEASDFFRLAKKLYPDVYLRLYTSGFSLDTEYLQILQQVGLDEIRFSIKNEDSALLQQQVLAQIALSKQYIPQVLVEMPVLPERLAEMKELLLELDNLGISGINLLEFCFPLANAQPFAERGYRIKAVPFRVLYNYWYAGGLPIAGSEENCLELLEFAQQQQLKIGVHYCSLENKHTGQVYTQNKDFQTKNSLYVLSERDYFLKSAKVFGQDATKLKKILPALQMLNFSEQRELHYLEFPLAYVAKLAQTQSNLEVGICYYVAEERDGAKYLKELKVDYTKAAEFNPQTDI